MMGTLTVDKIHRVFDDLLAAAGERKLEFCAAVRYCCRKLPLGETLIVAEHSIIWFKACCTVLGGWQAYREGSHTQSVLTICGRLVDEPEFEITLPDSRNHDWDATWNGPTDGWYSLAAVHRYNRQRQDCEGIDVPTDQPTALRICTLAEISKVATALPSTMSAWHHLRHAKLEAEARNLHDQAVLLRHQNDAVGAGTP